MSSMWSSGDRNSNEDQRPESCLPRPHMRWRAFRARQQPSPPRSWRWKASGRRSSSGMRGGESCSFYGRCGPRRRLSHTRNIIIAATEATSASIPRSMIQVFQTGFLPAQKMPLFPSASPKQISSLHPRLGNAPAIPKSMRSRIVVVHDGIDTTAIRSDRSAVLKIGATGHEFRAGDEIVTYVNRALEPIRGIHVFLRSLPAILESRPSARILIVGSAAERLYGRSPPQGTTWRDIFLQEIRDRVDLSRVHWLGLLDRTSFTNFLAVSRLHVYLTYPFVLSWSLLEAMSAGCLTVGSATPPVEDFIEHGRNGLLVDFFDHKGLADTVIDALGRPVEDFAPMREAARATIVSQCDRDAICLPRLTGLIESMAA